MAEATYVNSNEVRGVHLSGRRATANNDNNIYANVEDTQIETKDRAGYQHAGGTQRSRVVAVSLGVLCFLLLAGIIGLLVNYSRLTGNLTEANFQLQTSYANLTADKDLLQKEVDRLHIEDSRLTGLHDSEMQRLRIQIGNLTEANIQLQTSYANLSADKDLLQKEVDRLHIEATDSRLTGNLTEANFQLQTSYANLTADKDLLQKEVDRLHIEATGLRDSEMQRVRTQNHTEDYMQLQSSYANLTERFNTMNKTLTADKDLLQKEVDRLHANATGSTSENGVWKTFNGKSYLITGIQLKTWSESRQHCQSNGADLAIITSKEQHDFLVETQKLGAWIGLSDQASEGTWQWVDRTVLQGKVFWRTGEPNDSNRNEDCVTLQDGTWNDVPCSWKLNWICEK